MLRDIDRRWLWALMAAALGAIALAVGAGLASSSSARPPEVRSLPWAEQTDGAPKLDAVEPAASLVFPPGVGYAAALERLFVAAAEGGTLPAEARLDDPLPREVVIVVPTDDASGLRLSLTAPWGWTSDGRLVRAPSYALPGSLSPDEVSRRIDEARASGRALPEGARIDAPDLDRCQVAVGTPTNRVPC